MSDILKPKRQYKKRETKEQTIKEYKGGYIDEPVYNVLKYICFAIYILYLLKQIYL